MNLNSDPKNPCKYWAWLNIPVAQCWGRQRRVAPCSWLAKQANQRGQVLSPVKGPHVVEGPSRWLSVCRVCCPSLQTSDLHMCTVVCVCPHMHAHTYRINKRKCFNVLESSKRCPMPTSSYFGYVLCWSSLLVLSSSSSLTHTPFSHHQAHSAGCIRSTTFSLHPRLFQIPLAVLFLITTINPSPLPSLGASCPQFLQIHHRHGHKHHGSG